MAEFRQTPQDVIAAKTDDTASPLKIVRRIPAKNGLQQK